MASLAQKTDLPALLRALTPAELLHARQEIDALLTPAVLQEANQQLSPLLRLPRNVLDRIIDHAVAGDGIVVAEETCKDPGLLQTCSTLRLAASKAYFRGNIFKRKRSAEDQSLERWAKVRIGENRSHIRGVRLGWPLHCNNDEAKAEASRIEVRCGFPCGTVWCLSEDDFENDYRWWVNSLGAAEVCEVAPSGHGAGAIPAPCRNAVDPSVRPAPSWNCSPWATGQDNADYFSLRRGLPTPESRPSARDMR